ncbi:TonB-dependent receptor [Haliea sp. E17]|uniref:TonB-dependent receptor n=1 Tax=Haliea sp. E17 TaxID=3401576 RepID=UPI003AAD2617
MLEEVVVTAQRRSELASDVPITITTVNEEQLRNAGIDSMMTLPQVTPGLRLDQQGSYTQPTIRGIGTSVVQTGSGSSVGIYVDGYYMPTSLAADLQFLNVESVQVLKGPQGTLFGRNTPGGAILISTAEPSTETRTVLEASYGRFNDQNYQGYFTTALTDSIAFNIEGRFNKGDGFVDNIYDGSLASGSGFAPGAKSSKPGAYENWSARAGLKVDFTDRVSFLLRYSHTENDDPTAIVTGVYREPGTGTIYSSGDAIPGTVFGLKRGDVANNALTEFNVESDIYQLTGEFDLGFAELTSYTQYREDDIGQSIDSDGSSAAIFALDLPETDKVRSQEFLLNSAHDGALQYTAGVFLFEQKIKADVLIPYVTGYVFPYSATGVEVSTYAAFLDATYEVFDNLFLTGGLRYSKDEAKNPYYQTLPGVPGQFTYQPEYDGDKVTPRVVVRYKPTDQSSLYASYTEGYKSAIFDPRATSGNDYLKPEDVTAWEMGYKFAGDSMSASVAPFYIEYKNLQNAYYRVGETILSNAAQSTIKGIEGDIRYRTDIGLELSAAVTYMKAEYDEYENAGYFQPLINSAGHFEGFVPTSADVSGYQMQRAPDWTGNLGANYSTDLMGGELMLAGNLYYSSKFYFDPAHQFEQDDYQLLNARVQWTDPSGRYTIAMFGENLTDEKYFTQVNPSPFGAVQIYGKPVSAGVSLRVEL